MATTAQPVKMSEEDREKLARFKQKILEDAEARDPTAKFREKALEHVKDIMARLKNIEDRREQRYLEEERRAFEREQKYSAFAAGLSRRNKMKETEKNTARGQNAHRTRIEMWRDDVKEQTTVTREKQPAEVGIKQTATSHRPITRSLAKRKFEAIDNPPTTTPVNKHQEIAPHVSSPLAVPPTSSRKNVPWLTTRASMDGEDVFTDKDHRVTEQGVPPPKPEEQDDEEEECERIFSDCSYLTEQEMLLGIEMSMLVMMQVILPTLVEQKVDVSRLLQSVDPSQWRDVMEVDD